MSLLGEADKTCDRPAAEVDLSHSSSSGLVFLPLRGGLADLSFSFACLGFRADLADGCFELRSLLDPGDTSVSDKSCSVSVKSFSSASLEFAGGLLRAFADVACFGGHSDFRTCSALLLAGSRGFRSFWMVYQACRCEWTSFWLRSQPVASSSKLSVVHS